MKEILITGSQGQLGRALAAAATARGISHTGRDVDTLDIRDRDAVAAWIQQERPRVVVNCAAYTAVDDCEEHEDVATEINGTAVSHLARACNTVDALLIQVSTDYVFDGRASQPYPEDHPVAPQSAYGRSKLAGERAAGTAAQHLIARTAWLYGLGGRNFVEAICGQIEGGAERLRVVSDQRGNPTFCNDLAEALLDLAAVRATGIVHTVNDGVTSWHGFASEIVRLKGAALPVEAVPTEAFPRPAPRPAYSGLCTDRLRALISRPMPPWQDGLRRYMELR